MAVALAVDWDTIEKSAIAGVSFAKLAEVHGIDDGTIRQRAYRFKWPVPRRIQAIAREMRAQGVGVVETRNDPVRNQEIARATAETLHDTHARTAAQLVQASAEALGEFVAQRPPINDWNAASVAYKVQRLAAGIDKEGNQVRLNVSMFADSPQPVREVEVASWDGADVSGAVIIPAQGIEAEHGE